MIGSRLTFRAAIPAVAVAGLLAACGSSGSSGSAGSPFGGGTNAPAPNEGGPGPAPSHKVPAVFKVDACTMVPDDMMKEMEYDVPGKGSFKKDTPEEDLSGNYCVWKKGYTGKMLTIFINEGTPNYERSGDAEPPVESTLDGRKAIRYKNKTGGQSCETAIVVEQRAYVSVQADGMDTFESLCGKVDKALPSVSAKIPR